MMYLLFYLIGLIEEGVAMCYYLVGRQGHKFLCAMLAGTRIVIWVFITYCIFKNITNVYPVVLPYVLGAMSGNFLVLTFEKQLTKNILKIKTKKGRRQKRWWFWNFKNK